MVVQDGVGVSTCRLEREDDMGARVRKLEEELGALDEKVGRMARLERELRVLDAEVGGGAVHRD